MGALAANGRRLALTQDTDGWWRVDLSDAPAEINYAFCLDGGEPLPDPRSPWQPAGVFGPSRTVDQSAFAWTDDHWQAPPLASALVYELHVGTFTPRGTFEAAIKHLDHLVALGVTHVELLPVAAFPGGRGWGYDGVDLYAPLQAYGGPLGLKRLVDACHARGLAVLLDVVYNHLGPSGNHLGQFGPYFTDRYSTPWGPTLNLDGPRSDEVRRFLCDNALMWLRDYHFDGLRLDAVHAILDLSAVHLLEQLATEVKTLDAQLGRRLTLVAESDLNDPRLVRPVEAGGYGLDAQWSDDVHHALHSALTGERTGYYADFGRLGDLSHALRHAYVYDGRYSVSRQRRHGRPTTGLPGWRFLAYLQNHDQIGNRARGERSSMLLSTGKLKIAATLILTAPFVPMLFMGEEWGASTPFLYFTDHQDPQLAKAVSDGRRNEFAAFGWDPSQVPDPQAPETFNRSTLKWDEIAQEPHASLYAWHRALVALRRSQPALTDGRLDHMRVSFDEDARWLLIERGPLCIVCNLADHAQTIPLPTEGTWHTLLASETEGITLAASSVTLPAESVVVIQASP
ncbi:MAG: malto-oligosyltrehalose trehalohydrolase [Ktedonobacterales bacterium]